MKTKSLILTLLLASCGTVTTTTVTQPDGKSVTTVVTKSPPTDGAITTITNALLGGFLNIFESK